MGGGGPAGVLRVLVGLCVYQPYQVRVRRHWVGWGWGRAG